jgi:hypothetical protein
MELIKDKLEKLMRAMKIIRYIAVRIPSVYILKKVPYYSQWESPDLVDQILKKEISARHDPLWKHSGAATKEEYELWSWNSCGMACLKMVLKHISFKEIPLLVLAKKCEQYGGYVVKKSYPKNAEHWKRIDGLFYKPVVPFIKKEFGLSCDVKRVLVLPEIMHAIAKGNYVIASVDPAVREPKSASTQNGGHLVLITGYDKKKKLFYLHNPSGYYKKSQKYAEISFSNFKKFFAHKGFIIHS